MSILTCTLDSTALFGCMCRKNFEKSFAWEHFYFVFGIYLHLDNVKSLAFVCVRMSYSFSRLSFVEYYFVRSNFLIQSAILLMIGATATDDAIDTNAIYYYYWSISMNSHYLLGRKRYAKWEKYEKEFLSQLIDSTKYKNKSEVK